MRAKPGPWRVWVTRAQPGADATAARLRERGHVPLIGSLLEVHALEGVVVCPREATTLAFTSANAVRAFAAKSSVRDLPVFCVGATTAKAARKAGFTEVESADGDVSALAARIVRAAPAGLVLHPCATETAGDLEAPLVWAGVRYERLALYETLAAPALPPGVLEALAGEDGCAVLLHSPKAARVLAGLLAAEPGCDASRLFAFGLSPSCLTPLALIPFVTLRAAGEPREAALLGLLG